MTGIGKVMTFEVMSPEAVPTPVVFCPFPPRISPHAADVSRYALSWATRHGLVPTAAAQATFARTRLSQLVSRALPDAGQPELCLATAWLIVVIALEDRLDTTLGRHPEHQRRVVTDTLSFLAAEAGAPPVSLGRPLAAALHDLWARTRPRTTPAWRARFVEHMTQYLTATAWKAGNRLAGRAPSVADHVALRRSSAATAPYFDLLELLDGGELSPAALANPALADLRSHAASVLAWFNDLVSWRKELHDGDPYNLVLAVRHEYRLSFADAARYVGDLHDAEVKAFLAARDRLEAGPAAPEVRRVADGLAHLIRANVDWSYESARYARPDNGAARPAGSTAAGGGDATAA